MPTPQSGDFAVVSAGGLAGPLVGWAERTLLAAGPYADYEHAFIYTGLLEATKLGEALDHVPEPDPDRAVIQAEPAGTAYARLTPHGKTLWSTGKIPLTSDQRGAIVMAAIGYLGTPYSFLDYLAIGLHRAHIPIPHLKAYIASTGHQICSELVDSCYLAAGVHLFDDGRWPGYVTPADLAKLLSEAP